MLNTFLTHLQLFGIGFSFGIAGPCFLVCTPILIAYTTGIRRKWRDALGDTFIFLSGRLSAYIILGYLAGLSGTLLRQFTNSGLAVFFNPLAGLVSILLGIFVLINREPAHCADASAHSKIYPAAQHPVIQDGDRRGKMSHQRKGRPGFSPDRLHNTGSLFALGFLIGVAPCAPLLALLLQIALMSSSALEGAAYTLSFGMGTSISGLIVVGVLAGFLSGFTARAFKSKKTNFIFRIICALLLMLFGVRFMFGHYPDIGAR